jgi:outer membrane protein, heavy metal efflux system
MRRLLTAVGAAAIAFSGTARAQTAYIDPVDGLTLDEAVTRAIEREPTLRASRAQVDVVRARRAQAELRPNPSVSFSQLFEPGGSDKQTKIELMWPLDLSQKAGRVEVADREIQVAEAAAADRRRTLAGDVRMKYGEVAAAIRALTVTTELLTATTRQRTLVAARVDAGAAPPLDRDMLRVEVQRLDADRALQEGMVERRMTELKRLLALSPDATLALRQTLDELVRREPAAATLSDDSEAAATRSDVREADARVGAAAAGIDRARRQGKPDVNLFGMYMRMDASFPQLGFTPAGILEPVGSIFHYVTGGVQVSLPFQNRNQGAVAAAEADRTTAAAQLDAARLTAQTEIAASRLRDRHALRALDAYGADAIELARRNLDVVRQTYELGRGSLIDVLSEQRRYIDVERAYTDVLREAYDARQALKLARGEER